MLRIEHPTLGTLELDDGDGYVTESVGLPMPNVRDVVDNRTDADGSYDQTAHYGARAITASVVMFPGLGISLEDRLDALRKFLHPGNRCTLSWVPVGEVDRRQLVVRAASHDVTLRDDCYVRTSVGWVAPEGVVQSSTLHSQVLTPTPLAEMGRVYDLAFPRQYPAGTGPATFNITNAGTAPAPWIGRMYGPCDNPKLVNQTTGQTLALTGLSLTVGQYVELNIANHTARLNGDPTLSLYHLVTLASAWWRLAPGVNVVAYQPTTFVGGAQAVIEWRDAWL